MNTETFTLLQYPFMQRAVVAGVVLAALLAWLGVFVIMRRMSFFSDGIAHSSLAGIAIGILLNVQPLVTAVIFSILFALVIYFLERKTTLSSDAIIGMLFSSGMALGVVLINLKAGYQPDLVSFLFGNILAIRNSDLLVIGLLSVLIIAFLVLNHRQITLMSLDPETAYLDGIRVNVLQPVLYTILAVSVVLGLKVLGIVLVSALLIIPPSTAKLVSKSFRGLIVGSLIVSEVIMIAGIGVSYYVNLPTGPVIVLVGTFTFFLVLVESRWRSRDRA